MNRKAVLLLSGGLDSTLSGKIVKEQGIDLIAIHFTTLFNTSGNEESCKARVSKVASSIGVAVEFVDMSEELLSLVKNPKFGHGSSLNPCIDCHLFMFRKSFELGEKFGASFIVTGEVLGERPMSQRKGALELIDEKSGLAGLILRPLSAKLLEPTLPEKEGIVDREKLFAISGRRRAEQIALAKKFNIIDFPNPAGGCLLTDKIFGIKIKDLIENDAYNIKNMTLLKLGRHFRLSETTKLIIGRDETENNKLIDLAQDCDIILKTTDIAGPVGIIVGKDNDNFIQTAAGFVAKYSDVSKDQKIEIVYYKKGSLERNTMSTFATEDSFIKNTKIG